MPDPIQTEQVFIVAPTGRDAELAAQVLAQAGIESRICAGLADLLASPVMDVGVLLVSEEAMGTPATLRGMEAWLAAQASWSDLPVVVLSRSGTPDRVAHLAQLLTAWLGNVMFLERPVRSFILASAVKAAVRARSRQRQLGADIDIRALATERLAQSEARLLFVLQAAALGAWELDFSSGSLTASATCKSFFGLQPDDPLSYDDLLGLIHPDDRARVDGDVRASIGTHGDCDTECRVVWADGTQRWVNIRGRCSSGRDGKPVIMAGVLLDVTTRKQAEEQQILLMREVDHRAKNVLAVAQSVVRLTDATDPARYSETVQGRIAALARAHALLAHDRWQGADLHSILDEELAAHLDSATITLRGPWLRVTRDAVQPLAMTLHELTTNAAKYGALSSGHGTLNITWRRVPDGGIDLRWEERGGPPIAHPPRRLGFGSALMAATVRDALAGHMTFEWHGDGLTCHIGVGPALIVSERGDVDVGSAAGAPTNKIGTAEHSVHWPDQRILIVEDEPFVAMELASTLQQQGCKVVGPAPNLGGGLALAQEGGQTLDAAVLDYNLRGTASVPIAEQRARCGIPVLGRRAMPIYPLRSAATARAPCCGSRWQQVNLSMRCEVCWPRRNTAANLRAPMAPPPTARRDHAHAAQWRR